MGARGDDITVASFNVHAGIDGWGRRFDVTAVCRQLDADVLVVQEAWAPETGPSMGEQVAGEFGYDLSWYPMASGRRGLPNAAATARWAPTRDVRTEANALYLEGEIGVSARVARSERYREAERGTWGLAVLSRLPVTATTTVELGRRGHDRGRRAALVLDVLVGDASAVVAGTHMSHLTSGSPVQLRALGRALAAHIGERPAVLAGDMNLWGRPLVRLLPGWRRAVKGRTWPAWRPHSQPDHVLVRGGIDVVSGTVWAHAGSDHRPVSARLRLPGDRRRPS